MSPFFRPSPIRRLQAAVLASLLAVALGCLGAHAAAAEVMPPAPKQFFNDYAHVVSPATAGQLNRTLENFERETSSQILVAIYPKMESPSSIEDYTVRIAQSWKVGQKGRDNGAVLFVFIQDRKMFIQVGYGLEGVLPDALAKQIIENEIKPRFRAGDYAGGLTAGVNALLAATQGEYKGTGYTVGERRGQGRQNGAGIIMLFLFFGLFGLLILRRLRRGPAGTIYGRRGYSGWGGWTLGGGGWSGGGWGGGGWSGGGGGGGRFGGGGAGGGW